MSSLSSLKVAAFYPQQKGVGGGIRTHVKVCFTWAAKRRCGWVWSREGREGLRSFTRGTMSSVALQNLLERAENRDSAFHSLVQSLRPWESWVQIPAQLQAPHYLSVHASGHGLQKRDSSVARLRWFVIMAKRTEDHALAVPSTQAASDSSEK